MSDFHFVTGTGAPDTLLASPIADALKDTVYTDIVNMENYHECYFILSWGVGTTGTTKLQIQSCDDNAASNDEEIAFEYKRISSDETNTAWTACTSATGITTTAGSHQVYVLRVRSENCYPGYEYVRMKADEVVDAAVLGGCLIMMAKPRFNQETLPTVTG